MDSANCIAKQCAGKYVHPGRIYYSRFYCYHMLFGSVIAVMGIVIPAMLAFTGSMGISTIIPVMIAYIAINAHFILPFHNLAILVGVGEDNGMYTEKETIKFGVPFTIVLFIITVGVAVPWWKVIGLW